jgi:exodeoxyribonuclease III
MAVQRRGKAWLAGMAGVTHIRHSWTISMRIATYDVNGINGRLVNLLGWLEATTPDIVCLQELKAPDDKFPAPAIRAAGYGAIWHGQKS